MVGYEHDGCSSQSAVCSSQSMPLPTCNCQLLPTANCKLPTGSDHSVSDVEAALFELLLALLAAVLLDDAAVEEMDGAIGVPRVARIVRDHADGRAFAVQLAQELHHRLAVL